VLVAERRIRAGVRQRDSKVIAGGVALPEGRRIPGRHLLYPVRLGGDRDPDDMAAAARRLPHGCRELSGGGGAGRELSLADRSRWLAPMVRVRASMP